MPDTHNPPASSCALVMCACCLLQFTAFAKQYALEHGPIILEMDTYRCGARTDPAGT
jgi:hypothetical protein